MKKRIENLRARGRVLEAGRLRIRLTPEVTESLIETAALVALLAAFAWWQGIRVDAADLPRLR